MLQVVNDPKSQYNKSQLLTYTTNLTSLPGSSVPHNSLGIQMIETLSCSSSKRPLDPLCQDEERERISTINEIYFHLLHWSGSHMASPLQRELESLLFQVLGKERELTLMNTNITYHILSFISSFQNHLVNYETTMEIVTMMTMTMVISAQVLKVQKMLLSCTLLTLFHTITLSSFFTWEN